MINRNRKQTQYVFNSKTGQLEKKDNISTISEKAQEQKKKEGEPVTSVVVITAEDNLMHNYFYSYETSWDATNCLQIAIIKMPKMGQKNVTYWANYTGQLTIYMGSNFTFDYVNQNKHSTEQNAAESLVKYWDNSKVQPFFRGEIDKIKEYQTELVLYVKNIGSRFQQKIPEEFRQSYIYNQNVRDSFQAMCEFLGIQYICPPKTVTDSAGEEQDGATTNDGTQNDVGKQVANESSLANTAKNATNNSNSSSDNSSSSSSNSSNSSSNSSDTSSTNENADSNTEETSPIDDNTVNDIINGYDDISFDANGSIVHGSVVIETSPDMSHTLVAMEEHPFEKYLDDETGIIEKVNNFLNGEMFDELHNQVMDYGAITIEPASTTTSTPTVDATANVDVEMPTSTSEDLSNSGQSSSSSSSSSRSSGGSSGVKGVWGKTSAGSYYLTQDAINKMSMAEAKRRYEYGKAHEPYYTRATMEKLWYRMMFGTKFY